MERSKLVFFDGKNKFKLKDLLRDSSEILRKGSFGTSYKVVFYDECVAFKLKFEIYGTYVVPINVSFASSIFFGNTTYLHISVELIQILKANFL